VERGREEGRVPEEGFRFRFNCRMGEIDEMNIRQGKANMQVFSHSEGPEEVEISIELLMRVRLRTKNL